MSDLHDSEPPRKCRIIESDADILRALLYEEIDLEIGLRRRLQETVESRLAWALTLQDALEKHVELPEQSCNDSGVNEFADLAIATCKATDVSAELFYARQFFNIPEFQSPLLGTNPLARSPVQESLRPPRHAARAHVQLHHEDRLVKEPNRYLYLRDVSATPMMVYKVACPDCHRSDFPRLQGLLNHCRLKHQREFGSHDECVQACAVIVPEEEQPIVIERGLEVVGMSASLQRLFKMAVGSYDGVIAVREAEEAQELAKVVRSNSAQRAFKFEEDEAEEPIFITKTLGHHKDTPALAPFLGRTPRKRQIHVYDDNNPLDILNPEHNTAHRSWRKPYRDRCLVDESGRPNVSSDDETKDSSLDSETNQNHTLKTLEGSRFHIPVRLIVSDYSLCLPEQAEKQRSVQGALPSHKWMISVSTASYSLHISTVLARMSVACAAEPPVSSFSHPLTVSEPPFCVMGTSDEPFLAQITLEWVGTRNKPTQLQHWVQLHYGKASRPVKGDEQILDIELDRHTELVPRRNDTWKIDWSSGVDKTTKPILQSNMAENFTDAVESEPIKRLKKLLQYFPLTAQEVGSRKVPEVPYFLPLTPQHFMSLVEGRRKAIEIRRARAIWEAFVTSAPRTEADTHEVQTSDKVAQFSGFGDVYRWLKSDGHILGATPAFEMCKQLKQLPDTFCTICGLRPSAHRKGKAGRGKDGGEEGGSGRLCEYPSWAGKMPIVDVQDLCMHQTQTAKRRVVTEPFTRDHLIRLSQYINPTLIISVRHVVSSLRLSHFSLPQAPVTAGIISTREQREEEFAPYTALAASVRRLIHLLVQGGLQIIEPKSEGTSKQSISQIHGSKRRLLVPAHIVRGLVENAKRKGNTVQRALLLSMARLGTAVDDAQPREAASDVSIASPQVATDASGQAPDQSKLLSVLNGDANIASA